MKFENLYDLQSFNRFLDSEKKRPQDFADSYAGTVLRQHLTHISPTVLEKRYPTLAFVNSGIEADNSGGYANRIASLRELEKGEFRTAGDISSNKGKITLTVEDSYIKVIERSADSLWSDTEARQAELEGRNLLSSFIAKHNKIYQREIDEIGLIGVDGNEGLLNNSAFTSGAASKAISAMTAAEMYQEIVDFVVAQWAAVNDTPEYIATRIIMPIPAMHKLVTTQMDSDAGSESVLTALKRNLPGVQFLSSFRCNSVGGTSVCAAFSVFPEAMVMRLPLPLQIGEITKDGAFSYRLESKYRIAGLDVLEGTAGRLLTGL